MNDQNRNSDQLDARLAEAVDAVRSCTVSNELIERCRSNAIAIEQNEINRRFVSNDATSEWRALIAIAAAVILVINLLQAYFRMPPSDRQLAAAIVEPNHVELCIYSDLRVEVCSQK